MPNFSKTPLFIVLMSVLLCIPDRPWTHDPPVSVLTNGNYRHPPSCQAPTFFFSEYRQYPQSQLVRLDSRLLKHGWLNLQLIIIKCNYPQIIEL